MTRRLFSFMATTLDGFVEGPDGEFDWPNVDAEFEEYSVSQLNDVGTLLFGSVTYGFMASYWPSPQARLDDPVITQTMNDIEKIVFSATLARADWNNSTLVASDAGKAVAELKRGDGKDLALFGSATLTVSLLEQGLVDELRVMVNPILLGGGRSLFAGLADRVRLTLVRTTTFSGGNVLLVYRPTGLAAGLTEVQR